MSNVWPAGRPRIGIAHSHYDMKSEILRRIPDADCRQATNLDDFAAFSADIDVLVISMLWQDRILEMAPRLKLVQSVSAGTDHYPKDALRERGIHLCSALGVNANAVSDHALALMLAMSRRLPEAFGDQARSYWRPTSSDPAQRLQELSTKTVLLVGYGHIGARIARLCRAFGMNVIVMRRNASAGADGGLRLISSDAFIETLPEADFVVLACPLTSETQGLMSAEAFAGMRSDAALINVARGRVVDEAAMIAALKDGQIAAAALDTFVEEPLPPNSPLWTLPNVIVTPHAAGETQFYERNVVDILLANIAAMETGSALTNQAV